MFSFNGEAVLINKNETKGILVRGYQKKDLRKIDSLKKDIFEGTLENFNEGTVSIGKDLALFLDLCSQFPHL